MNIHFEKLTNTAQCLKNSKNAESRAPDPIHKDTNGPRTMTLPTITKNSRSSHHNHYFNAISMIQKAPEMEARNLDSNGVALTVMKSM